MKHTKHHGGHKKHGKTKHHKMHRGEAMHIKPIHHDGLAHSSHGAHNREHGTPMGFAPHDGYKQGPTHCAGIGCNEKHD